MWCIIIYDGQFSAYRAIDDATRLAFDGWFVSLTGKYSDVFDSFSTCLNLTDECISHKHFINVWIEVITDGFVYNKSKLKTTAYIAGVYPSSFGMNEDAKNDGTLWCYNVYIKRKTL